MVVSLVSDCEALNVVSLCLAKSNAIIIHGLSTLRGRYSVDGAVVAGRRVRLIAGRVRITTRCSGCYSFI